MDRNCAKLPCNFFGFRPSLILIFLTAFHLLEGWYITAVKNSSHSHDQQYLKLLICLSGYTDTVPKNEVLTGRHRG